MTLPVKSPSTALGTPRKYLLALETTCDETAAAVITDDLHVLGASVASQDLLHREFEGVVPEIASRAHVQRIIPVVERALGAAGIRPSQLAAVSVATTPGLAGSLIVGLAAAKSFAVALGIPLVATNHLQAHVYACRMEYGPDVFPCVGLIVSGGHTSLYLCRTPTEFELLGTTIDDAAGEAFDKVASLLGLSYPGGPAIAQAASQGNPRAVRLPRPMLGDGTLDFSFSGLKTAVRYKVRPASRQQTASVARSDLSPDQVADLAASFQEAVVDVLVAKSLAACELGKLRTLCVGGGVAANERLRERLAVAARESGLRLFFAPREHCTDNAIMGAIAWERLAAGLCDNLGVDVTPGLLRRRGVVPSS